LSALPKQTVQSRIDRVREIIDSYPRNKPFSKAHCAELSELSNTEIRFAVKRRNPMFPKDERHLHVTAGDWPEPQQWSWREAIRVAGARNPEAARANRKRQKLMFALRYAVKPDMDDFRAAAEPRACRVCWFAEDLSTDHIKPPFLEIATAFLERYPDIELREVQGCGDLIASVDIEAEWIAFHAARATYQLLCRSCNSRKGAR
jgi:hypothetical protein